jgi:hypothetical protein
MIQLKLDESRVHELMLDIEELAQTEGYRNFAKFGDETKITPETQKFIESKADNNDVVKHDGSVALTDNWITGYKITADQIASSIAMGTAPLEVVSTTVVTNLNADLLDGVHASALEPTVTKGNLTAGSNKISIGGTGTGAVIGTGVSVDVAQANLDHGSIGGLSDDDHTQYVKHSLAEAVSDFLVGAGTSTFTFVKKTLAEVKTILGLGSAAYTASTDYAVSGKGVTNGDSHDHVGGDGSQIDHGGLGGNSDDDHSQYLRADATRVLSADWDIGNGRMIQVDKIRARDGDGVYLVDKDGKGLYVKDGGNVGFGITPEDKIHIDGNVVNGAGITINTPGTGTAKYRMGTLGTTVPNWSGQFINCKYNQADNTWNLDNTSLNGAFFKLDVRNSSNGNAIAFYRMPAGSNPRPDNDWVHVMSLNLDTGNILMSNGLEIDGDLNHDGSNVGFYGTAPVAKPTVTGSKGGNAALASLITALASIGLIVDNTT